jgi:hypothetical protein
VVLVIITARPPLSEFPPQLAFGYTAPPHVLSGHAAGRDDTPRHDGGYPSRQAPYDIRMYGWSASDCPDADRHPGQQRRCLTRLSALYRDAPGRLSRHEIRVGERMGRSCHAATGPQAGQSAVQRRKAVHRRARGKAPPCAWRRSAQSRCDAYDAMGDLLGQHDGCWATLPATFLLATLVAPDLNGIRLEDL